MRKIFLLFSTFLLNQVLFANLFGNPSYEWRDSNCYQKNTCFFIGAGGGYEKFYHLPDFQYGQDVATLAPLSFLEFENETASGWYGDAFAGMDFCNSRLFWLGDLVTIKAMGHYFDDDRLTSIANIRSPATLLFPNLNGIGTTNVGVGVLSGTISRKYAFWGGDLDITSRYFISKNRFSAHFAPFFRFGVHEFNQWYRMRLNRAAVTTLTYSLNENVKTTYYDIGGGAEFAIYPFRRISIYANGGVFASYASSKFNGNALIVTDTGVFTPSGIEQKHHVWNSKVKTRAGITYSFKRVLLEVTGKYEYWGYIPAVSNPLRFGPPGTPLNHPAKISNANTSLYSIGASFAYSF